MNNRSTCCEFYQIFAAGNLANCNRYINRPPVQLKQMENPLASRQFLNVTRAPKSLQVEQQSPQTLLLNN